MFEDLSSRFEEAIKSLKGETRLSVDNIRPAIKKVKQALLDADVSYEVVVDFLRDLESKVIGIEVVKGVTPKEKFVEIVHNKLIELMGDRNDPIKESEVDTTTIMLVGLQGAGKTTAAAKLGLYLKRKKKKVLLVAADTFRPAAKEQLRTLGEQIGLDVHTGNKDDEALNIASGGVKRGKEENYQYIIIDTAGRLFIDEKLMSEIRTIRDLVKPEEVLLVVDSMIGQEAAALTREFDRNIGITGSILTKLDGDSRGGAALSIKGISGKPIKFIGTGEKVEGLEPFHPERMASRILGMGDILSLVEKAEREVDLGDVITMQKKFQDASFDFTDFLKQIKMIKRMGSIGGLIKLIPGMNKIDDSMLKKGEEQLIRIQSMVNSMTKEERACPILLLKSRKRRKRIALGSGSREVDVEKMLSDFERMRIVMQNFSMGNMDNDNNNSLRHGVNNISHHSKSSSSANHKSKKDKKKGFGDL